MSAKLRHGSGQPGPAVRPLAPQPGFSAHRQGRRLLWRLSDVMKTCQSLVGQRQREWTPVTAGWLEPLLLAKPQTYMNHSGVAAAALARRFGARGADMVVAYDDLDLPFGHGSGSAAAGRPAATGDWRRSCTIWRIATSCRLRVGIGRPPAGVDAVDYVLSRFSPEEMESVDGVLSRAGGRGGSHRVERARLGHGTTSIESNRGGVMDGLDRSGRRRRERSDFSSLTGRIEPLSSQSTGQGCGDAVRERLHLRRGHGVPEARVHRAGGLRGRGGGAARVATRSRHRCWRSSRAQSARWWRVSSA